MKRKKVNYTFKKKRNYKLITPCCNRLNKDGKFINWNELPENYGHCYSCGKPTLPPTIYLDDCNNEFIWNETLRKYEPFKSIAMQQQRQQLKANVVKTIPKQRFIDEKIIWKCYMNPNENNLIKYLKSKYPIKKVDDAIYDYVIGTDEAGRIVFWLINKDLKVQKDKRVFYNLNGKRSNKIKSVFQNENGYYSCLFGEHLLTKSKITLLVESEKTALVGSILLPEYTWLAYGGSTQLTDNKIKALKGYKVLLIPDISNKAVQFAKQKIARLNLSEYDISIWDLTYGKTDDELRTLGIYNDDLEDYFRKIKSVN